MNYYYSHNYIFCQKDISDYDQVFKYKYPFNGATLTFEFSIQYIRTFFLKSNKSPSLFPNILLKNNDGIITNGNYFCDYTKYDLTDKNISFPDFDDIFVAPFPSLPLRFIVIDGNHRLSLQVYSNKTSISARYCSEEICEKALVSALNVAIYSCLLDCSIIKSNISKRTNLEIKRNLRIFNNSSLINNLENRGINAYI